jgi:Protein of unknown function (DUF3037)
MSDKYQHKCRYFYVRYIPDISTDEGLIIGVIVLEVVDGGTGDRLVGVRFSRNFERLRQFDSHADVDMILAIEDEISHRLATPLFDIDSVIVEFESSLSNAIQISPAYQLETESPMRALEDLFRDYVEHPLGAEPPQI